MKLPNLSAPALAPSCDTPEMRIAIAAAAAGAAVIVDYFERGAEMRWKDDDATYNLVSDADIQSEQAIAQVIQSAAPGHAILGEEEQSGSTAAEHLWVVDPLDGTNNFAHRIPHFAISVAYYHRGVAKCGVVVNPVRSDWYLAVSGGGAFHNGQRMQVSPDTRLDQSMIGCGFYYDRGTMMESTLAAIHEFFKQNIHGIRRFGAAALDLCQVADGLYGVFFEYQLAAWDFAAGRLILEEAGGTMTTGRGDELPLATSSVLASNGELHSAALSIVGKFHPV
ncbi:inositol monophosphatase family protein [Aureliella helgolandensis]|uniref:Inositol-1-monophosphatase n=1 Tax=Aureliella helgolandensis TaxID=2527968 RepID=A0A518G2H3_9BACT|nr:inositol monophosphatase family protein [Aureliella helgolandensis]QDV22803.1 Inositol-1-monophosphatase [Aureliella helgolandensis]